MGDRRLLGLQLKSERLHWPGQLLKQRVRLLAGSSDEEHQVVGVPDEPVGRMTGPLQVSASAVVAAHLPPVRQVVAVQRGEGDVRQQRRGDCSHAKGNLARWGLWGWGSSGGW